MPGNHSPHEELGCGPHPHLGTLSPAPTPAETDTLVARDLCLFGDIEVTPGSCWCSGEGTGGGFGKFLVDRKWGTARDCLSTGPVMARAFVLIFSGGSVPEAQGPCLTGVPAVGPEARSPHPNLIFLPPGQRWYLHPHQQWSSGTST